MAGLNGTITMRTAEYRPCIVGGQKALFHRWQDKRWAYEAVMVGTVSGILAATVGIIEREDGSIHECYPHEIIFCDNLISQYCFPETKGGG